MGRSAPRTPGAGVLAFALLACHEPSGTSVASAAPSASSIATTAATAPLPAWMLGGPGVRVHPTVEHIEADELARLSRTWGTLVTAMSAGDEDAVRATGRGCAAGPEAFLHAFRVPEPPDMVQKDPKKLARWPTRRDRLTAFGSRLAREGITIDSVDAMRARGFVGPVSPAMPSVALERDASGSWWVCSLLPGE